MGSILKVNALTKKYKDFMLENINFEVRNNSIVGFVGANGAGKTTTIKLILGLIHADGGEITYFNDDSYSIRQKQVKDRIGVVLDDSCFYEDFTIAEMKKLIASSYSNWDEKVYLDYLEQFQLNPKSKIKSLSKGMKMKFSLALALSHHAELLIMDEPSSGLDPLVRKELNDILINFAKTNNNSVFFSTHITSDLDRIADTIIFIHYGKIKEYGDKSELLKKYAGIHKGTILEGKDNPNIEDVMIYFSQQGEEK